MVYPYYIHQCMLQCVHKTLQGVSYISVDAHILATPVIDDINLDGVKEELLVPVSYFFDFNDYM